MEADISAVTDGGESVALMEPMVIAEGSRHRGDLTDFAVEVAARSAGFRRSLPDGVRTALAGVRILDPKKIVGQKRAEAMVNFLDTCQQ